MHWLKRSAAACLAVLLLLTSLPMALAAPSDQPLTRGETASILLDAAKDYNKNVTYQDILKGYPNGDLDESGSVTRAQALVMLQRAFGGLPAPKGDNARSGYPAASFTDVPSWAKAELKPVFDAGIVAGTSPTTFSPDRNITGAQLDLFLRRTYALEGTNLKDDFYATVNKTALDNSVISPGTIGYSSFTEIGDKVSTEVAGIIQELVKTGGQTAGEKKIVALYQNILNIDARNQAGITPIQPYLTAIDQAQSIGELMDVSAQLYQDTGVSLLLGFSLAVDNKDSDNYLLYFDGMSPLLGQAGYHSATDAQKSAYLTYVTKLLTLLGQSETAAAAQANALWTTDTKLAAASYNNQELGDVDKTYNLYTMAQLQALFPQVDLTKLFQLTGLTQTDKILVQDPGRLNACAALFDPTKTPDALEALKSYARLNLAVGFGALLNQEFTEAGDAFNLVYLGQDLSQSLEETASSYVQTVMSGYLGQAYAQRYFSAEAKQNVEKMVLDMLSVYRSRIQKLDWMSEATKAKALKKLDTMKLNLGYPDTWEDEFDGVDILPADQGGSFYSNVISMQLAGIKALPALQKEGVDKTAWPMGVCSVNACYSPTDNSITFPAAILQVPFYDVTASYEENLGKIGYVIAHEITHAFDNNGAKYDENGNAADWWTASDYAAFQKLCDRVTALYDGKEFAPGITCNGALTLSENIADLGAVACVTEIESRQAKPDYATLYRSMAEIWASSYGREMRAYLAQVDVHAPDKLRGSLVLQNFSQFYDAFGITEQDAMWLAPQDRVTIW